MSLRSLVAAGFLLAFSIAPASADSWQPIGPKAGAVFDVAVHPSNSKIILLAGYLNGTNRTYRTEDGGATCSELPFVAYDMFFDPINENTAYALADYLYRSDDAGATWNEISTFYVGSAAVAGSNPNRLYAGKAWSHEMYTSIDAGATWTPIATVSIVSAVYPLVVDPVNPSIVFAGTYGTFDYGGEGLFKTTNAGLSWTNISPPILHGNVTSIAIDPSDPQVVYSATEGAQSYPGNGLLKSTDGGATWDQSGFPNGDVREVLIDPQHTGRVYVLVNYSLHVSHDAGGSWTPVTTAPVGVADIDLVRADTDVLVAAADGVFVSEDAGASFTHWGVESVNLAAVLVDRTNSNILYATGVDGLHRTADGASSWEFVCGAWYSTAIVQDPANPAVIYDGAYSNGGVWKSVDSGATWTLSLAGTSISDVAVARTNPSTVFACGLYWPLGVPGVRAIFKSTDAGANWSTQDNLLNSTIEVHPLNDAIVYAGGTNGVGKSIDGGATWAPMNNGLDNPASGTVMELVIDPTDYETVYCGTSKQGIYKSEDGGAQWSRLTSPMTDVRAIEIDPVDPHVVYAAAYAQGIFVTVNDGQTWSPIGDPIAARQDITVDPSDRNTLYMAGGGVWRYIRTTSCATPAIESHQPDVVNLSECEAGCTLTFNVDTADDYSQAAIVALERGTDEGWVQEDEILAPLPAPTWQLSRTFQSTDAPGDYVFRVVIRGLDGSRATSDEDTVAVGTGPTAITPIPRHTLELEQNRPNPFNPSTTISFHMPSAAHAHLGVYNVSGEMVAVLLDRAVEAGSNHVVWNGRSGGGAPVSSGIYFYRLTTLGQTLTRRMVLLK